MTRIALLGFAALLSLVASGCVHTTTYVQEPVYVRPAPTYAYPPTVIIPHRSYHRRCVWHRGAWWC